MTDPFHHNQPTMFKLIVASLAVVFAASTLPSVALAQGGQSDTSMAGDTYFAFQVEQPVRLKSGSAPVYPERLRSEKIEGQVLVQYIVDERGYAQMDTFKAIKSNDDQFTQSVKRAVSRMSFYPAEIRGKKVKQLVQQPFSFVASR